MKKIRVLVVDDSPVARTVLEHVIRRDARLEIAGAAGSAEEAMATLDRTAPDVIALDIRLPGIDGIEATRRIMAERPTPIVLVSAGLDSHAVDMTIHALEVGALAAVEKPVAPGQPGYEALAERLCTQLAIMSDVKVVRQRPRTAYVPTPMRPCSAASGLHALAIAASTGGPSALAQLLPAIGSDFPLPILLVQHITGSFLDGFAAWLATLRGPCVQVVENSATPSPGTVYIAAPDRHLVFDGRCVRADDSSPALIHRPSATVLFRSVARHCGAQAIGVLLTGMGDDGAEGLLEMRRAGAYTIVEDASTTVVNGMPGSAARLGAACESLPLPAIAPRVLALAGLARANPV